MDVPKFHVFHNKGQKRVIQHSQQRPPLQTSLITPYFGEEQLSRNVPHYVLCQGLTPFPPLTYKWTSPMSSGRELFNIVNNVPLTKL